MQCLEQVDQALEHLRLVYGTKVVPPPVATHVTRWGADPLSRGAYSYVALGSSPADMVALGAPVGRSLFWAGEATSERHAATVRNAVLVRGVLLLLGAEEAYLTRLENPKKITNLLCSRTIWCRKTGRSVYFLLTYLRTYITAQAMEGFAMDNDQAIDTPTNPCKFDSHMLLQVHGAYLSGLDAAKAVAQAAAAERIQADPDNPPQTAADLAAAGARTEAVEQKGRGQEVAEKQARAEAKARQEGPGRG